MKSSGIKVTRQEVLSTGGLADLLRKIADQVEKGHAFSLQERPIVLAHQVHVRQEYRKKGMSHAFLLQLTWEEALTDQTKVQDESEDQEDEVPDTLDETGVPTTPLELPSSEERARLRER